MTAINSNRNYLILAYSIPSLIVLISIILAFNSFLSAYPELAIGVTYDLLVTSPLVYLFFIRKTNVPKITVVPVFTLGIVFASFLIPNEQQYHLSLIKTWFLPVIEIGVLSFVSYSAYKTYKTYKILKESNTDVYSILQETCKKISTIPIVANAFAFESATIYYAFISWKKFELSDKVFSYHKKSGTIALFAAIIFIFGIETFVLHIFVVAWSPIIAWVLTISSLYFMLQMFAHLKAILQRPIEILGDKLIIRYGLFADTEIKLDNIESIEFTTIYPSKDKNVRQLSILNGFEQFNTKIELKKNATIKGFYGLKSTYKTLLLFVDEKEKLKQFINININNKKF